MISAVLWKEYREQRSFWLALAFLTAGVVLVVPWAFPPQSSDEKTFREVLLVVSVMLSWTYGIVCGGMLLAGEREFGTQSFLDTQPVPRLRLWVAKLVAGLVLVGSHVFALCVVVTAGRLVQEIYLPLVFAALLGAGLLGLGWGMLFSARAGSVLAAIGQAILAQLALPNVVALFVVFPLVAALAILGVPPVEVTFGVLTALLMLALPWPLSARIYSRQDRERGSARAGGPPLLLRGGVRGWRSAWWLAKARVGGFALGLMAFCFAAGFPLVAGGLVVWPILSLLVGLVCGVTAMLDEQHGPYRFLGDQRFPLARLWFAKSAVRALVGILCLMVALVPSAVVMMVEMGQQPLDVQNGETLGGRLFASQLIGRTIPLSLFVLAPAAYGFSLGSLCGLVFRKPLVALCVGLGLAALLLSVWLPSVVTGGLHGWQVLMVPLVPLVAALFLLRPWAGDRLASLETFASLGGAALACVALTAGGLWYRVAEIPAEGDPVGLAEFVAGIPSVEENEGGRAVRAALLQAREKRNEWDAKQPTKPLVGEEPNPNADTFWLRAHRLATLGGPADAELAGWLDAAFAEELWAHLDEARRKPVGVLDDPRRRTLDMPNPEAEIAGYVGALLAARGLQKQAAGEPGVFVDNLDRALAMVRNLQNGGSFHGVVVARQIENEQLSALGRWLEALDGHPELLKRVGEVLDRHLAWVPPTYEANELAEYLITLNSLDVPKEWIRRFLHGPIKRGVDLDEAELIANSLRYPWERERQRRILRLVHDGDPNGLLRGDGTGAHRMFPFGFLRPGALGRGHPRRMVRLNTSRLAVALRHHLATTGKPAERLEELMPRSLKAVPPDPFDGRPLRYRLSKGESIEWPDDPAAMPLDGGGGAGGPVGPGDEAPQPPKEEARKIPAGQGIIWSVGEDHQDDGGRRQGYQPHTGAPSALGEDLIFLVPMPKGWHQPKD